MMSNLPDSAFDIASSKLGQLIFAHPDAGIEARLEFYIELIFKSFDFEDDEITPILRVNGICPNVKSWLGLAKQKLQFPYSPKPGSVDAGVHLFYVQNPAAITEIHFGSISDNKLHVSFNTEVDFEIEADSELGQIPLEIETDLEVMPLRVATSIEKSNQSDPEIISNSLSKLIELNDYQPIEKVAGGFEFPIS